MFFKLRYKLCALFLVLVLAAGFTACSGNALNNASKGLSTYTIDAVYNPVSQTVTAHQKVKYVNNSNASLSELKFHLYPAAFREDSKYNPVSDKSAVYAYPEGKEYGNITVSSVTVGGKSVPTNIGGENSDILSVPFENTLYPTGTCEIEFDFTLTIPKISHRFGYGASAVNLGNWYPIACVYTKGQFETSPYYNNGDPFFSETANYEVSLTLPAEYTVASSGTGSVASKDGQSVHKLSAKAVRDFAMVLSKDFKVTSATAGKTVINYYYIKDEAPENSLQAAADSLSTFGERFGEYPYPSLAVVETCFLNGGMEYPALVMISDRYSGDDFMEIIVHEIAHQWWYAVVGNNQVSEAWLDEGLAEYSTSLFYEFNPQYNVSKSDRLARTMRDYLTYTDVYKALRGEIDTSMNRRLDKYGEFEYVFMIYSKGALLFDSLRKIVGDAAFFDSLKHYYKTNMFGIADQSAITAAFEHVSKKALKNYFNAWVEGTVQILEL